MEKKIPIFFRCSIYRNCKFIRLSFNKENKIDVLKIDTEGYEFNILKGITKKILKK